MPLSQLLRGRPIEDMRKHMLGFAASFGVTLQQPDHIPNTRRALAMAEFARGQGQLDAFRDIAMEAHWNRGLDLENDADLRTIADEAGLDADAALAAADSAEMQARVDALGDEARRWGVTGIPTYFILPDGWAPGMQPSADGARPVRIVGCQPYETVLAGCMRAQVPRRHVPLE
jgi:2-hydroxychromene-2-carboxylate isomerase